MNEPTLSPLEAEASSPSTDKGWYRIEPFNTTSTNTVSNQDTHSSTLSSVSTIRYEWNKRKQLYKQSNTNNTNDDDLDLAIECPLQPAWKMLLFGDGSPTKLLGLLTGSRLTVQLISMEDIYPTSTSSDTNNIYPYEPIECLTILKSPLVRRKVYLMNERSEILGYAVSWWNKQDSEEFLLDKNRPIGGNMATSRLDVYRELVQVNYGTNSILENYFLSHQNNNSSNNEQFIPSCTGLWCRYYLMWRNGKPLNLIYEVFSPLLEKYMGKCM